MNPNLSPLQPMWQTTTTEGISLRDWFAGQVLAGLMADPNYDVSSERLAVTTYAIADAMLKERCKGDGSS